MSRLRFALACGALALVLVSCADNDRPLSPLGDPTPSLALVGSVVAPDGQPVADARLVLEPVVDGSTSTVRERLAGTPRASSTTASRVTLSDAAGRFRFDDVADGDHLLSTEARDHLGAVTAFTVPALAAAMAETVVVDVQLTPTGSILGNVQLENEISFENTVVYLDGTSFVAVTNAAGEYVFDGVPVGSYGVVAVRDGFLDGQAAAQLTQAGEVATAPSLILALDTNVPPDAAPAPKPREFGVQNIFVPTTLEPNAEDPDGTIVLWEWDFENDGAFDWADSSQGVATFHYATPGTQRAKLRVTDEDGARTLAVSAPFEVVDGIFVSVTSGNDANQGTRTQPVETIQRGIDLALAEKRPVVVEDGTHASFVPESGIDMFGGYEVGTWVFADRGETVINASPQGFAFVGVSDATYRNFSFVGADAATPGGSSIGAAFTSCPNTLVFEDCIFVGGSGANGTAGINGIDGLTGGLGQPGAASFSSDGSGAGGNAGFGSGRGGAGGGGTFRVTTDWLWATDGETGQASPFGPAGGPGGTVNAGSGCVNGSDGEDGTAGADGIDGSGSPSIVGEIDPQSSSYQAARGVSGADGEGGAGGGGGAGAGGNSVNACTGGGAGGGGGGAGGTGGTGGEGGLGGGSSIAVFLVDSQIRLVNCSLRTSDAGNGGAGGDSGLGANGVFGGPGATFNGVTSGRGGVGGDGGDGGGGQGGPGGSAIGLVRVNSAPEVINADYVFGSPGLGGTGGLGSVIILSIRSQADDGPDGATFAGVDLP